MMYLLDIHSKPPCIVLASDSADAIRSVGQRYADQTGRDLVVANGPRSDAPDIRPTIAQAAELKLELVPPEPSAVESSVVARVAALTHDLTPAELEVLRKRFPNLEIPTTR